MARRSLAWAVRSWAVLALAGLAAAQWNDEEQQKDCKEKGECSGSVFVIETTIPDCQCTDLVPVFYAGSPTNGTCLQQVTQDNCGQPWMQQAATDEVKNGYCDISCGRCDCCKTYAETLSDMGASTFLQMANAAGLKKNLSAPGYSFTVLAPPDNAFPPLLAAANLTMDQLMANVPLLRKVVNYHILPNVPVLDAWWSTPFLLPGTLLSTLLGPTAAIRVGPAMSLGGGAAPTGPDMPTCKGNIIPISAVLVPPATAVAPAKQPENDPSATVGAGTPTAVLTPAPAVAQLAAEAPQLTLGLGNGKLTVPDGLRSPSASPSVADASGR